MTPESDKNSRLLAALQGGLAVLGGGESGTGAALLAKAKGLPVFLSDGGSSARSIETAWSRPGSISRKAATPPTA